MKRLLAALCGLLTLCAGCTQLAVHPGPNALQNALDSAADLVVLEPGDYGDQRVDGSDAIFLAREGATLRSLDASGSRLLFSGVDVDGGGAQRLGLHLSGDTLGFHNGSVGNIHNEKGALVSGEDITIDHTRFHDVTVDEGVHNEAIYAISVQDFTLRDSTFSNIATFDLFLTYPTWWGYDPPPDSGITLEGNHFGKTYKADGSVHYFTVMAANTGTGPGFSCNGDSVLGYIQDWTVRDNVFELPTAYLFDCPARRQNFQASGNVGG